MTCKDCIHQDVCRYTKQQIPLCDCTYDESVNVEEIGCPFIHKSIAGVGVLDDKVNGIISLKDFLYHKTAPNMYAIIKLSGYVCGIVYIDYEDLSTLALPPQLLDAKVESFSCEKHKDFTKMVYIVNVKR